MRRLLVATDFSTRSDRALRRTTLLAQQNGAELVLVHVVDEDQPALLRDAESDVASKLLRQLAQTVKEADGVSCAEHVVFGDPSRAIADFADKFDPDLIALGPHRRGLRDVFSGTTAERAVRRSLRPILIANASPVKAYERILLAVDFSEGSLAAIKAALSLDLGRNLRFVALTVIAAPAGDAVLGIEDAGAGFLEAERRRAAQDLSAFCAEAGVKTLRQIVHVQDAPIAKIILDRARLLEADLIVIGTHGKGAARRFLLGSVADAVLRDAEIDVLAVPAREAAPAS